MTAAMPALNAERLWSRVEALSRFTLPDQPWTRRAFTDTWQASRDWLAEQYRAAGLAVSHDAAGNLVGRREGTVAGARVLATGSHCDTVPSGGRFDGIIGVLAGIEIAHSLHEQGARLRHPLEVIDFLSEEPSDYGVSCVGSRGIAGMLGPDMLAQANPAGETLAQGLARVGGDPGALARALRGPDSVAAFVELHIEQGPVLENEGLPIGVVTHIVGIRRHRVIVEGRPDHAGTTPMDIRQDALVGAARLVDEANRRARGLLGSGHYVVATVGYLAVTPNASNAVPGRVEMMLEVRSDAEHVLDEFTDAAIEAVRPGLQELGVRLTHAEVSRSAPTACAPLVMQAIEDAAADLGYRSRRMPSGAGHDAVYMSKLAPVGMVFIPCLGGRSHCPEEWIEPAQLLDGTRVLHQTLLRLDAQLKE